MGLKKKIWNRHHSYSGKLWKTIKTKQVCEKPDFGSGSRLRVGKVLAPYRARPRAVPLIKKRKADVIFKILIFPKNNKTKMLRETKYIFFLNFLGPTRIDFGPTYSHLK